MFLSHLLLSSLKSILKNRVTVDAIKNSCDLWEEVKMSTMSWEEIDSAVFMEDPGYTVFCIPRSCLAYRNKFKQETTNGSKSIGGFLCRKEIPSETGPSWAAD